MIRALGGVLLIVVGFIACYLLICAGQRRD